MEKNPVGVKVLFKSLKFESAKFGEVLFCYLPNSSILYAYGPNSNGQLGLGHTKSVFTLTRVPNIVGNIQRVISDDSSTFILTDQGLFACGCNSGQLGLGHANLISTFTPVPNIAGKIQQVITGYGYTFALTDQGLFVCGHNDEGQLGLGHTNYVPIFTQVTNIAGKTQQITTSKSFRGCTTYVVTDQGLYACGYNGFGHLGLGHTKNVTTFTPVPNIKGNIQQVTISKSTRGYTTYVVTDQGLFACGYTKYGKLLGLDHTHTECVSTFTPVQTIAGNIRQVITDNGCTVYVHTDQILYAYGSNEYGQLGLGHNNEVDTFTRIPNITGKIQQVITNGAFAFVLTDQGLYACGEYSWSRVSLARIKNVTTFTRVPNIVGNIQEIFGRFIQTDEKIHYVIDGVFKPMNLPIIRSPLLIEPQLELEKEEVKILPVNKVKAEIKIPPDYLCPISHQIMLDPVMAADGYTYEREKIQEALSLKLVSPITNDVLDDARLLPNRAVRSAIAELLTQHPELWEEKNVQGETVYFSMALQNQAITALQAGTLASLAQCLVRDPRLLTHSTPTTRNFLELACQQGSFETLNIVLKAIKKSTWEEILKQTSAEKLFQLCSQHLEPEAAKLLGDNLGWTVDQYQEQAYTAIKQGNMQLLSTCLMAGVSVNAVNAKGKSLINYAAECRRIPIVVYLLKAGAKVKLVNNDSFTPGQETPVLEHESSTQAIDAEQIKANLQLLNLDTDNFQTSITPLVEVNQLQEQVALLTKTVQQLQAEVAYLKEQLKANVSNNPPLLGSQLPTFSSTPDNDSASSPTSFFRK